MQTVDKSGQKHLNMKIWEDGCEKKKILKIYNFGAIAHEVKMNVLLNFSQPFKIQIAKEVVF